MIEWISVKDRLPAHHETVLTTDGKGILICWIDIAHDYLFMIDYRNQFVGVTHWMYLPDPPI